MSAVTIGSSVDLNKPAANGPKLESASVKNKSASVVKVKKEKATAKDAAKVIDRKDIAGKGGFGAAIIATIAAVAAAILFFLPAIPVIAFSAVIVTAAVSSVLALALLIAHIIIKRKNNETAHVSLNHLKAKHEEDLARFKLEKEEIAAQKAEAEAQNEELLKLNGEAKDEIETLKTKYAEDIKAHGETKAILKKEKEKHSGWKKLIDDYEIKLGIKTAPVAEPQNNSKSTTSPVAPANPEKPQEKKHWWSREKKGESPAKADKTNVLKTDDPPKKEDVSSKAGPAKKNSKSATTTT